MMLKTFNRLRRNIMILICPNYLDKKLSRRKGKCKQCGKCCLGCDYLKDNKCIVYEKRPWFCHKNFPIDEFDKRVFDAKNCGYWFKV